MAELICIFIGSQFFSNRLDGSSTMILLWDFPILYKEEYWWFCIYLLFFGFLKIFIYFLIGYSVKWLLAEVSSSGILATLPYVYHACRGWRTTSGALIWVPFAFVLRQDILLAWTSRGR